ncbi:MAG: MBOAT family protein [Verrucomicrobiota bacterium]
MARLIQMTYQPARRRPAAAMPIMAYWCIIMLTIGVAHGLLSEATPVLRMVALVATLFLLCKFMVYQIWHTRTCRSLTGWDLLCFLFPWPGMRPDAFVTLHHKQSIRAGEATCLLIAGIIALAAAHYTARFGIMWLAIPLLLAGFSLTVHFGLLGWLTAILHTQGYRVRPPFLAPWKSRNLNEFWSQRWNRPFTELLTWTVYRPIAKRWTRTHAIWAGFLASGLLHEIAISLPVQTGYGLPTLYFLIQAAGVMLERHWQQHVVWRSIGWWLWLLLPLPLVFHAAFIDFVLFPLIGIGGAP